VIATAFKPVLAYSLLSDLSTSESSFSIRYHDKKAHPQAGTTSQAAPILKLKLASSLKMKGRSNRKRMKEIGMSWIDTDINQFIPICNEIFGFFTNQICGFLHRPLQEKQPAILG
jgi:hypothetical protein